MQDNSLGEGDSRKSFDELIQLYQNHFGLNINVTVINENRIIEKVISNPFCRILSARYPELCNKFTEIDSKYPICKAGLLCYHFPLVVDDKRIGLIYIGQKIIKGYQAQQREILINSLINIGANATETAFFELLFDKLDLIDIIDFDDFCTKISFIAKTFHLNFTQRYYSERRIYNIKRLTGSLAHQFITPIQGIMAYAENLIIEYESLPQKCQDLEIIEMATEILTEIQKLSLSADNLRNWIVSENDWLYRYDFRAGSIMPLIMHSVKLFRNEAKSRGILIKGPIFKESAPPKLIISPEHLTRVFYNLLNNSVKYSYEGSPDNPRWIEINCWKEEEYYCTEIANYGVGILPDELDSKIYQIGYRGKLAIDRNRNGSGLGLWVVRKIIEDHRGKIKITSEPAFEPSYEKRIPFLTKVRIYLPVFKEVG